eukprot:5079745-Alexandrium_andersonii.AAC.1
MTQALESFRIDADNARKNEEQLKNELVEIKRREMQNQMAAESKALEKAWHPVTTDVGIATVTAPATTMPVRTVTSSGPAGPE